MHNLLTLWLASITVGLASPDYTVREKAQRKANNIVYAQLAPKTNDCEAKVRIEQIQYYQFSRLEWFAFDHAREVWYTQYLLPERNKQITLVALSAHLEQCPYEEFHAFAVRFPLAEVEIADFLGIGAWRYPTYGRLKRGLTLHRKVDSVSRLLGY